MDTRLPDAQSTGKSAIGGHGQNGFDLLRHVAALIVILGHAFPLTGNAGPAYLGNGLQTIAVKVFFVASGFLVFRSWRSDPNVGRYLVRRVLRIFPALVVVTLVSVFVLGPIFTTLPMGQYFANPSVWRFFYNTAFYPIYNLPGVFAANKYPAAINGSLWTLPVELALYLLLPILAGRTSEGAKLGIPVAAILMGTFSILYMRVDRAAFPRVIYGTDAVAAIEVAVYFLIGAVYALFGLDRFSRPMLSILLLAVPAILFYNDVAGELALLLLLPFAVISFGTLHLDLVDSILRGRDLSYGLYLYAFPVQQAAQALTQNSLTPYENFFWSAMVSAVLAFLSWTFVERRALALKPRHS